LNKFIFLSNRQIEIILHVVIWAAFASLPLLIAKSEFFSYPKTFYYSWVPLIFSMIVFYINYFFLIPKFFFKRAYMKMCVSNIILIILSIILLDISKNWMLNNFDIQPWGKKGDFKYWKIAYQSLSFILTIGISISIRVTNKWIETEKAKREIENTNLKSELQLLKYQIQPHFFFNSLNNVYALIDQAPEKAKETVYELSKLLRFMLNEANEDKIIIENEVECLKNFIKLMSVRLNDNVTLKSSLPDKTPEIFVAPLLFLTLIENAFKHGVSATKPSFIDINMTTDINKVTLTVVNSYFPKDKKDRSGSGIGLGNLKQRLEKIYPGQHEFSTEIIDNTHKVKLEINTN
jgi:sensor histidine kinase YesM